jgi:hypothetical protein
MLPPDSVTQAIDTLVSRAVLALQQAPRTPISSLPPDWLSLPNGEKLPLWVEVSRHLFSNHWTEDQVRYALQWAQLSQIGLRSRLFHGFNPSEAMDQPQRAFEPERILRLAAHAHGRTYPGQGLTEAPASMQDQLLQACLAGIVLPTLSELDLTQMLVYARGKRNVGTLMHLRLQAIHSAPLDADWALEPPEGGRLIVHPSSVLLWTDKPFRDGLSLVQQLLNQVLLPDAPAIAWGVESMALPGDEVQSVSEVQGPSATAAIAYGALYLLRLHLRTDLPHVAALRERLCAIEEPNLVSITAQLRPSESMAQPWPLLEKVGGVDEKLTGLSALLPTGRHISHRYVAHNQTSDAHRINAHRIEHLGQLIERIEEHTSSTQPDARALQSRLLELGGDQAPTDPPTVAAMERLAASTQPGIGVRAHLLWRYACLCVGQPRPFGDVTQVAQHFVPLLVEGPQGHGARQERDQADRSAGPDSRARFGLQSILYPEDSKDQARWKAVARLGSACATVCWQDHASQSMGTSLHTGCIAPASGHWPLGRSTGLPAHERLHT